MKYLFLVIVISCSISAQQKYFTIEKNNQGGFNFYNKSGELVYEYTKQNTDSASPATLNDLYFESDKLNKQQIAVINLQEKGFDFNVLIVALSTLTGIFLGWILNRKSTKHQTLLQNKKEWLDKFRNQASKTLSLIYSFNHGIKVVTENKVIDDISKDLISASRKFIVEESGRVDESVWNFQFMLDNSNEKHVKLSTDLDSFEIISISPNRNYSKAIELHKSLVQDVKDIIAEEQNKIYSGKL